MRVYGFAAPLDGSGGRHNADVFPEESEEFGGDCRNCPQFLYVMLNVYGFLGCCPVVPGGNVGVFDLGIVLVFWHRLHGSRWGRKYEESVAES